MGSKTKTLFAVLLTVTAVYIATLYVDDFNPAMVRGKRVLITGASSGIGEQVAYHFAKMGANLVLTARRENLLKKVIAECKKLSPAPESNHVYTVANLGDMEETARVIKFTENKLGGLDILILNHAILPNVQPWLGTGDNFTRLTTTMDVNFRSYVHLASHAIPLLTNSRGHISVVSSTAGVTATPYTAVYTATKYALQGFFGVLRQELALYNSGVSVTLCMVGATRTERAVKSFVGMFGSDWHNTIHPVEPELVALEITKATVTRQYEVYTSTDIPSKMFISLRLLFPKFADKMMLKSFSIL